MSITSTFNSKPQLSVIGDSLDNDTVVSRNAAGAILRQRRSRRNRRRHAHGGQHDARSRPSASAAMTSSRSTKSMARCRARTCSAVVATTC